VASGIWAIPKIPELRKRLVFMILMLGIYRVGVFVPVPGTDRNALSQFFQTQGQGTLFGLYDMFSGGALEQFSIFVLGIMPYISASIIFQLLAVVMPSVERLQKEGDAGRRKITQWTRYATIGISVVQGLAISAGLENMTGGGSPVVLTPGWSFRIMTVITVTAGTAFIMWLGEQISERGIGNGISLIIFAGIVARFPSSTFNTFSRLRLGELNAVFLLVLVVFMVAVIAFIIYVERAQRRIPIQYARRASGRGVYGRSSTHLPLKVNTAGVIPPIFASSLLMFPATIGSFVQSEWINRITNMFSPGGYLYETTYLALIIFFCFFYTAVVFNPVDVAENLKKYGGSIPGIYPGADTANYIDRILTRLTLAGSIYVGAVCVLPDVLIFQYGINFYFGGTSLLIVVGVAIDTVAQIESHLLTHHYDNLMGTGGSIIRGRTRRRAR
jgi:preprotein translocase subunit SecY